MAAAEAGGGDIFLDRGAYGSRQGDDVGMR